MAGPRPPPIGHKEVEQGWGSPGTSCSSASLHPNQRQRKERNSSSEVSGTHSQCRETAGVWGPAAQPGLGRSSDTENPPKSMTSESFSKKGPFCNHRELVADKVIGFYRNSQSFRLPSLFPDQNKVNSSQREEDRKRKPVTWGEGVSSCMSTPGLSPSPTLLRIWMCVLSHCHWFTPSHLCLLHGSDGHFEFRHPT